MLYFQILSKEQRILVEKVKEVGQVLFTTNWCCLDDRRGALIPAEKWQDKLQGLSLAIALSHLRVILSMKACEENNWKIVPPRGTEYHCVSFSTFLTQMEAHVKSVNFPTLRAQLEKIDIQDRVIYKIKDYFKIHKFRDAFPLLAIRRQLKDRQTDKSREIVENLYQFNLTQYHLTDPYEQYPLPFCNYSESYWKEEKDFIVLTPIFSEKEIILRAIDVFGGAHPLTLDITEGTISWKLSSTSSIVCQTFLSFIRTAPPRDRDIITLMCFHLKNIAAHYKFTLPPSLTLPSMPTGSFFSPSERSVREPGASAAPPSS